MSAAGKPLAGVIRTILWWFSAAVIAGVVWLCVADGEYASLPAVIPCFAGVPFALGMLIDVAREGRVSRTGRVVWVLAVLLPLGIIPGVLHTDDHHVPVLAYIGLVSTTFPLGQLAVPLAGLTGAVSDRLHLQLPLNPHVVGFLFLWVTMASLGAMQWFWGFPRVVRWFREQETRAEKPVSL